MEQCERTLFVGVDNYDAPILSCILSQVDFPMTIHPSYRPARNDIESLFLNSFWIPLQQAAFSGVVAKSFLTGILPLYPQVANDRSIAGDVDMNAGIHLSLGFTESEVSNLVEVFLRKNGEEIIGWLLISDAPAANTCSEVFHAATSEYSIRS